MGELDGPQSVPQQTWGPELVDRQTGRQAGRQTNRQTRPPTQTET
eukprot:COSAG03_NODE_8356_length_810_cov_1.170183_2_plen_44_part_01